MIRCHKCGQWVLQYPGTNGRLVRADPTPVVRLVLGYKAEHREFMRVKVYQDHDEHCRADKTR